MSIHSTLSEVIWKRSRNIYEIALIRCINGFTKPIWCLMQENIILSLGKMLFCLGNNKENKMFLFHNILMENSKEQKIFRVTIDTNVNFKIHISELCKKASQKITALSRLSSYLNNSEEKLFFNSIIKSQFSYCFPVWMFCSITSNNMINKLHERSLRIMLHHYSSDLNILLENNNDICNHHRNI